jgi:collagen type III alpha
MAAAGGAALRRGARAARGRRRRRAPGEGDPAAAGGAGRGPRGTRGLAGPRAGGSPGRRGVPPGGRARGAGAGCHHGVTRGRVRAASVIRTATMVRWRAVGAASTGGGGAAAGAARGGAMPRRRQGRRGADAPAGPAAGGQPRGARRVSCARLRPPGEAGRGAWRGRAGEGAGRPSWGMAPRWRGAACGEARVRACGARGTAAAGRLARARGPQPPGARKGRGAADLAGPPGALDRRQRRPHIAGRAGGGAAPGGPAGARPAPRPEQSSSLESQLHEGWGRGRWGRTGAPGRPDPALATNAGGGRPDFAPGSHAHWPRRATYRVRGIISTSSRPQTAPGKQTTVRL